MSMKPLVVYWSVLVGSMLTGCAAKSDLNAVDISGTPPVAASYKPLPVGTVIVQKSHDGTVYRDTVVAVEGDVESYSSDSGWTWSLSSPWDTHTVWDSGKGRKGTQNWTGNTNLFPFEIGKKFKVSYDGSNEKESFKGTKVCKVAAAERITLELGDIDTFRIDCSSGGDLGNPWRREQFHYAPSLGTTVRSYEKTREPKVEHYEVLEIVPPA